MFQILKDDKWKAYLLLLYQAVHHVLLICVDIISRAGWRSGFDASQDYPVPRSKLRVQGLDLVFLLWLLWRVITAELLVEKVDGTAGHVLLLPLNSQSLRLGKT